MASKSTRNLTYVLLGVSILALLLVGLFRARLQPVFSLEEVVEVPEQQDDFSPPVKVKKERQENTSEGNEDSVKRHAANEEDAFAVRVDGEPLTVILPWYEEIGKISVEKYDREGNATGKPLESGTMVQIPDPFQPGERIRFVVP